MRLLIAFVLGSVARLVLLALRVFLLGPLGWHLLARLVVGAIFRIHHDHAPSILLISIGPWSEYSC